MLWEVELKPVGRDGERERVCDEFDLLTHSERGGDLVSGSARGFVLTGDLDESQAISFASDVLTDPLAEICTVRAIGSATCDPAFTVLLKPGVMDPVSESVETIARDLGTPVRQVRTFRRYFGPPNLNAQDRDILFRKVLANDAIERVVSGSLVPEHFTEGKPYSFRKVTIPLLKMTVEELVKCSREMTLALSKDEMVTIQNHFRSIDRDPTDAELETIAQTWSEHCSHKTLKGTVKYTETINGQSQTRTFKNLLKETVFAATQQLRTQWGNNDWCVSVFSDNAGIVKFNDQNHLCIKVETHNRPSAIEPYGGSNTGLGGVIRDVLGTGLAAKPICNTDIFCFARPDYSPDDLPLGVLHPRRAMLGVVSGVRDYGNRMGIPTVNGAIHFDDRYLANPLVFCGTVGLMPIGAESKKVMPGDLIVAVGGRTGRDGIHGATFSSEGLTAESESISGGAVQIGNAIAEKKVLDVILQARNRNLFTAITDCGAGGFSSAVGEMGAEVGAVVDLDRAPLKYDGLSYTEIWISESQERMVLSVPPAQWPELEQLCKNEGVEAAVLGTFVPTGRLTLNYQGQQVADLSMEFLHDGIPKIVREANFELKPQPAKAGTQVEPQAALLSILKDYTVCSKEWVIRQYDHEVQGGSVVKPLTGVLNDGPSDAAVVMPVLGDWAGAAVGCGMNPQYADLDPGAAAAAAIDEAMRNVVAVGANPKRVAILDNFCWGGIHDANLLGALVRTAETCKDVALAYGTPFISGKDSLNNQFHSEKTGTIQIPHTLLISALGFVPDVRKCVTMDWKSAGNAIYLIGETKNECGGSHFAKVTGGAGGTVPRPNIEQAPKIFQAVFDSISAGLIRSCHDCSEGGLAVALAEMAFAGGIGADISGLKDMANLPDEVKLFSESTTRFVVEVTPENEAALHERFAGLPLIKLGTTVAEPRLRIAGTNGEWVIWAKLSELKEAWQKPLRW
ncbi:MAG: phosphoribosylformylglycinamidine synthase subunit PurL [Gemmataceae bacterium]